MSLCHKKPLVTLKRLAVLTGDRDVRGGGVDDVQRFTDIFQSHFDEVLAYARRRVHESRVDDVVEETFLAAWRNLDRVPEDSLPWLYRAAWFVLSHEYRRQSGAESRTRSPIDDSAVEDIVDDVTARDLWSSAFSRLSQDDQEVLRLTGWEGLTSVDAARVLGCSIAAFKVRLHRARGRLVGFLDEENLSASAPSPRPPDHEDIKASDLLSVPPSLQVAKSSSHPSSDLAPRATKEICP
jgi:RNA polymerase sigma-70 factor, ECF subfamily